MTIHFLPQFFALARAQVERLAELGVSAECSTEDKDLVLRRVVPSDCHPTRPSWCAQTCRYMDDALRFVAAYHWMGGDLATGKSILQAFVRGDRSFDARMEEYAGLAAVGTLRVAADAPCRSVGWAPIASLLSTSYVRRPRSLQQLSEHLHSLGPSLVRLVVRDARYAIAVDLPDRDSWLPHPTREELFALELVRDGLDSEHVPVSITPAEARVVCVELLRASPELWWESEHPWTVDHVAAWAVQFAGYARERLR